ncbi:uncharacterized protein LOC118734421 [Rhagoletis pomonella]|uniref:uncharacterized protein LOC118734421 n=1 Tax=Rhagoletis pomonella TaxID=28610 RepID=UPI00177FB849|nr:uncharacterized protein LOC118734421 [Rhagoletis pomonella]
MSKLFLVVLFITAIVPASNAKLRFLIDEVNRDHAPYAKLALYMTERYITPKARTLIIMENCEHCKPGLLNMHTRLLRYFLKQFNPTMSLQLFFGLPEERLWDYNLFIVDSMHAFKNLSIHIPVTHYEYQFHFFIILTLRTRSERKAIEHMEQIFMECLRLHVGNVVLMFQFDNTHTFHFYTYTPFGVAYCRKIVDVAEFNNYANGRLAEDRLFPPHFHNFHGCTLNVCLRLGYPFVGHRGDDQQLQMQNIHLLDGLEADILKILAKAMNFHVNISIPKEDSVIGEFQNSTGCFAELASEKADIALGCLSSSDTLRHVFSYSITYHQSPFVFIVRSGLHFGPIKQLALGFCKDVWLWIGSCCLVGMILIRLVVTFASPRICEQIIGHPRRSDCTNLIVIMMGNPINSRPHHICPRLLLMTWLLATLVLRNAYQAKLFETLRISRRIPVPRSIAGLAAEQYKLIFDSYVDFYPRNMTTIQHNLTNRYGIVQDSETPHIATVSMLDTLAWHNQQNWQTSRLTYVDEPIYNIQLSMFFKKHSMLRMVFDNYIKRLMTSGITSHIASKHVKKHFQVMNTRSQRLPAISSNMLKGLYMLYLMLMGLGCTLFGLELLTSRCRGIKRIIDWFHNVEGSWD